MSTAMTPLLTGLGTQAESPPLHAAFVAGRAAVACAVSFSGVLIIHL